MVNMSLQIGMAGLVPMYQQLVIEPTKFVGAALLGEPGCLWRINVDGLPKDFPCAYAAGLYKFDFTNPNVVKPYAEPYRMKYFQERHDAVPAHQHRVVFSGAKPFTTENHETGQRSIFIRNETANKVRVEVTVVNPSDNNQRLTIKPFVLLKDQDRDLDFSDDKFKEQGIEQGQQYFDALAKEEQLIYVVRFTEYSKLTTEP